jgi:hypothetical protein
MVWMLKWRGMIEIGWDFFSFTSFLSLNFSIFFFSLYDCGLVGFIGWWLISLLE